MTMTLANFARMCELLEDQRPTAKVNTISESLSSFDEKYLVINILSIEYPVNNIAETRAINWIATALGLLED